MSTSINTWLEKALETEQETTEQETTKYLYHIKKFDVMADKVVANYGGGYTIEDVKSVIRGYKKTDELLDHNFKREYYTRKRSKYMFLVDSYTTECEKKHKTTKVIWRA